MRFFKKCLNIYNERGISGLLSRAYHHTRVRPARKLIENVVQGNLKGAFSWLTQIFLRRDLYLWYAQQTNGSPSLFSTELGEMYLDPYDRGLSRELLIHGTRETETKEVFESELSKFRSSTDEQITIFEVGANLGWNVLVEYQVLNDQAQIIAFEPSPKNYEILLKNIELHGAQNNVETYQAAISAESGIADFEVTKKTNHSRIKTDKIRKEDNVIEDVIQVEQYSIDEFLQDQQLPPDSIDVLRLDVEGFEVEVFKGMMGVLESTHPMLIFIETHAGYIDDSDHEFVIDVLRENGFELVHASYDEVDSFEDELVYNVGMELVLKREGR